MTRVNSIFDRFHISAPDSNTNTKSSIMPREKQSSDIYVKNENNIQKKTIAKWTSGIVAFALGGFGLVKLIKSGRITKMFKHNVQPKLSTGLKEFITTMKPKDEQLAKEFFDTLEKNAENFDLKRADYNGILEILTPQNKGFIKDNVFPLLEKHGKNFKEMVAGKTDLEELLPVLNEKNLPVFSTLINNTEKYKITMAEDIVSYLKAIKPEKQDFILNEIFPLIFENTTGKTSNMNSIVIADILEKVSPKNKNILGEIINYSDKLAERKITVSSVFRNVDENNYKVVKPLLENMEKIGITNKPNNSFKTYLSLIQNDKVGIVEPFANSISNLNKMNINIQDVLNLLTNENAKILPIVTSKPELYPFKSQDVYDLKQYLTKIKPENIEFIDTEIMPKIEQYKKLIPYSSFEGADLLVDAVANLTPKAAHAMDIFIKHAKKLDQLTEDMILPDWYLLSKINNDNINNLDFFLTNVDKFVKKYDSNLMEQIENILKLPSAEMQKLL